MLIGIKTEIYPTEIQKEYLFKAFGIKRFAYNWALNRQMESYKLTGKILKDTDLRKEFTQFKKSLPWLSEVNNNVTKQAIKDCCVAYKNFFNKIKKSKEKFSKKTLIRCARKGIKPTSYDMIGHPKFKKKKLSEQSFYNDTETIQFIDNQVRIESLGWVKMAESRIPMGCKYYRPTISFDGLSFYVSVAIEVETKSIDSPKTEPIGIDLGIRTLMTCSNGMINNTPNIKKDIAKLRRLQRRASKLYIAYRGKEKSKNLLKLELEILKLHKRITNKLNDNVNKFILELVKLNPKAIVIEDLNVKAMFSDKSVAKYLKYCKFGEIRQKIINKCSMYSVDVVLADRYFPSSKLCSQCGCIKKKLKRSDKIYTCEHCGAKIDRDFNASINLANLVPMC